MMGNLKIQKKMKLKQKSDGVVLIALLTMLVVVFTTLMISTLSVDKLRAKRITQNSAILNSAEESLLGYALAQIPPGTLPCPDTTGDGLENSSPGGCLSQRGLFPYRTLNASQQIDRSGAALWYAVELGYVANDIGERNPSRSTSLSLDGDLVAAVILAPGKAIEGQARVPLNVSDFLEGDNADVNLSVYTRPQSSQENDQVLGLDIDNYWSLMSTTALETSEQLLSAYKVACLEYPWAASFGGPYTSIASQQIGSLALTTALPFDWGSVCPSGIAPTPPPWLTTHWQGELYYSMCTNIEGSCIQTVGDTLQLGSAIVLSPGVQLAAQSRPSALNINYFELENILAPTTQYRDQNLINNSATYNDVTRLLTP